ncbi:hypothetical protein OUZ56_010713 [Daphnia magna]|uniref:Uncharacterized protein n=1 Tax=Daphnia magna TaxID=35525 RepID=A0ABQ9YYE5_9CRUS|nr:hypothetical protein OUZ56_010713 [Daphnia magna]
MPNRVFLRSMDILDPIEQYNMLRCAFSTNVKISFVSKLSAAAAASYGENTFFAFKIEFYPSKSHRLNKLKQERFSRRMERELANQKKNEIGVEMPVNTDNNLSYNNCILEDSSNLVDGDRDQVQVIIAELRQQLEIVTEEKNQLLVENHKLMEQTDQLAASLSCLNVELHNMKTEKAEQPKCAVETHRMSYISFKYDPCRSLIAHNLLTQPLLTMKLVDKVYFTRPK